MAAPLRSRRRPAALTGGVLAGAVLALLATAWTGINFDVRYVVGGLRVSDAGTAGTFVHRPFAYRALVAALDAVPSRLPDPTGPLAETVLRAEAVALAVAAALLLGAGLRRSRPGPLGPAVAAAVAAALVLAPGWTFLEPEWFGAVAAVAATGAALSSRSTFAAPLAGLLLLVAAAVKLTTAPYALVALGAVAVLDGRRTLRAAAWAAGLGVAWLAATRFGQPEEWQWLLDMAALNPFSPLQVGLDGVSWPHFWLSVADTVIESPVLVGLPAAAVALVRSAVRPAWSAAALVAGLVLVTAPVIVQAQWFLYQWAALPVLAAALVAAAAVTVPRAGLAVLAPVALAGAASAVLLSLPVAWRDANLTPVVIGYGVLALVAVPLGRREPSLATPIAAVLAGVLAFGAAQLPAAGYAFSGYSAEITNAGLADRTAAERASFAAVRDRIGPATPVLYLAFGDVGYLLGNPTPCRYPSPVWLQRSTYVAGLDRLATYQDNARCLADPAPRWLVHDTSWFDRSRLDPALDAELTRRYDCTAPLAVPAASVILCPAR